MYKPLIILDIDGVLNSENYASSFTESMYVDYTYEAINGISLKKMSIQELEDIFVNFNDLHRAHKVCFQMRLFYLKHAQKIAKQKHTNPISRNKSRGKTTNHRAKEDYYYAVYSSISSKLSEVLKYIKFLQKCEK